MFTLNLESSYIFLFSLLFYAPYGVCTRGIIAKLACEVFFLPVTAFISAFDLL